MINYSSPLNDRFEYFQMYKPPNNEIVHPIVREIMEQEKNNYLEHGYHVIMDIPLLYENELQEINYSSPLNDRFEYFQMYKPPKLHLQYLVVHFRTTMGIQIDRLMERNNLSLEDAKARVYSQISIDKKSRMI
jgi:dephospho-CoA kinase